MHILPKTMLAAVAVIGLIGCAGRAPTPVALVQVTDPQMDCYAISLEAHANNVKLQQLGVEEGNKVGQNVAMGVAGLFIWPLWFAMDFQDAAGKEVAAINSRNQYLAALATQRRCGAPQQSAPLPPQPYPGS